MKLSFLVLVGAVIFCHPLRGDEFSHYKITQQRSNDAVSVDKENGVTVFNVVSSNGIGWAKIQNEKAWPMKAVVRLNYKSGRQWQHLEGFSISSSRATISSSLRGGLEVRPLTDKGRQSLEGLSEEELAERVGLQIKTAESGIEIELPMTWLAEESEITIRWIDLYRN